MHAVPTQANPFPHPRKIRYSRNEVYRRAHLISVGHQTQGTAHQSEGRPIRKCPNGTSADVRCCRSDAGNWNSPLIPPCLQRANTQTTSSNPPGSADASIGSGPASITRTWAIGIDRVTQPPRRTLPKPHWRSGVQRSSANRPRSRCSRRRWKRRRGCKDRRSPRSPRKRDCRSAFQCLLWRLHKTKVTAVRVARMPVAPRSIATREHSYRCSASPGYPQRVCLAAVSTRYTANPVRLRNAGG
jgi:hypothetical protein